jgi:hypothetical protein
MASKCNPHQDASGTPVASHATLPPQVCTHSVTGSASCQLSASLASLSVHKSSVALVAAQCSLACWPIHGTGCRLLVVTQCRICAPWQANCYTRHSASGLALQANPAAAAEYPAGYSSHGKATCCWLPDRPRFGWLPDSVAWNAHVLKLLILERCSQQFMSQACRHCRQAAVQSSC